MKVFCSECRFFDHQYGLITNPGRCLSACNYESMLVEDTWKNRGVKITTFVKHPKEINENNDCKWYEEN